MNEDLLVSCFKIYIVKINYKYTTLKIFITNIHIEKSNTTMFCTPSVSQFYGTVTNYQV